MTVDIYREAVKRGAELLDERKPGWRETVRAAIAADDLHMDNCWRCVLGHVYGANRTETAVTPYNAGLVDIFGQALPVDFGYLPENYGFEAPVILGHRNYERLADAWRAELAESTEVVS